MTGGIEPWVPWPPAVAARYRAAGYWRGQTFGALLTALAAAHTERTAVVGGGTRWTYAELDDRAHRIAAGLAESGVVAGDRVVVQLPNVPEFLPVVFGLWRLGAWPVFALPAHRESELRHLAAQAEAVAIITVGEHERHDHAATARTVADAVPSVRAVHVVGSAAFTDLAATTSREFPDPDPAGVAFLQLSGGTTGLPKLIPRTHDDYLYSVRESMRICALTPESVYLAALPVAHNYPLSSPGVLGALHAGAKVVLAPRPDADTAFALIEAERVTITGVVPPLAAAWVQAAGRTGHDLSSLDVLLVGGAKCGRELAERIGPALGCTLQQVFGMAEGLVCYTRLDDPDELVLGTQGRPISPADEILVESPDANGVGALLTRGPYTIRGYYQAAEHNAVAFTPDGFYRTGDLVRQTASGHLEVVGRAKEQINRGGEKVAAEEVENHLMAHPGVLDAAVVAVPDEYLGERTCAYVVPADGAAPTGPQLRKFVRECGVAAFKVPDLVRVVDAFPVTGVGKTSKRELRAALAVHATDTTQRGESMSLPKIAPYELPGAADLPAGRVSWPLDPGRAALLVHDAQRYFLTPYAGSPIPQVLANVTALLAAAHAAGMPVFYTAQPPRPPVAERGLQAEFWGPGIGGVIDDDPHAADIVDELAPTAADTVLVKWRYSAFQRSTFHEDLVAQGRDQLLITGVYGHIGCQATAVEAFMRDIRPFFVADAVADFSRAWHDKACEYVAQRCGVVTTTADVLSTLAVPAVAR